MYSLIRLIDGSIVKDAIMYTTGEGIAFTIRPTDTEKWAAYNAWLAQGNSAADAHSISATPGV